MKHHYVPQFYLKQWSEADGKVPYFRWLGTRTIADRIAPRGTAFEHDLYARENVPEKERHAVEDFFSKLDSTAAPIHQRLRRLEKFTFTAEERTNWAMFLVAANLRVPEMVRKSKTQGTEALKATLNQSPEEFERVRGSTSELTLLEWTENRVPGLIENFGLEVLVRFLGEDKNIQPFMDLEWSAHSIPSSNVEFLTGDRPLWYFQNPQHSHFSIVMPLSPRTIFVGSRVAEFSRAIIDEGENSIARKVNTSIVSRANERVYGRAKFAYVDKTFKATLGRLVR